MKRVTHPAWIFSALIAFAFILSPKEANAADLGPTKKPVPLTSTLPVYGMMYLTPNDDHKPDDPPAVKQAALDYINNVGPNGCKGWTNTHTQGVNIRTTWWSVEPAEGQYDWDYIDAALTQAKNHGKQISLLIVAGEGTPAWVYGDEAVDFQLQTSFTKDNANPPNYTPVYVHMSPPWDPVMQAKLGDMIHALAFHLTGKMGKIAFIVMSGWGRQAESYFIEYRDAGLYGHGITGQGDAIQADMLAQSAIPAYTDFLDGWYQGGQAIIGKWMSEFPSAHLVFDGGNPAPSPALSGDGGVLNGAGAAKLSDLSMWASSTYPGPYGFESDGLTQGYGSGQFGWQEVNRLRCSSVSGYQFVLPQTSLGAFDSAVQIGISQGARYIQVYPKNADDPTFCSTIDQENTTMMNTAANCP